MNRRIQSSHLALRFYKHDGWTREDVEKYLVKGGISDTEEKHLDYPCIAYFRMDVGSVMDMDRLMAEEKPVVIRWYDGEPKETDLQYLKSMNW